jgi:hypothetical protein
VHAARGRALPAKRAPPDRPRAPVCSPSGEDRGGKGVRRHASTRAPARPGASNPPFPSGRWRPVATASTEARSAARISSNAAERPADEVGQPPAGTPQASADGEDPRIAHGVLLLKAAGAASAEPVAHRDTLGVAHRPGRRARTRPHPARRRGRQRGPRPGRPVGALSDRPADRAVEHPGRREPAAGRLGPGHLRLQPHRGRTRRGHRRGPDRPYRARRRSPPRGQRLTRPAPADRRTGGPAAVVCPPVKSAGAVRGDPAAPASCLG